MSRAIWRTSRHIRRGASNAVEGAALIAAFNTASDLDYFPYRTGVWTISNGTATATDSASLVTEHYNILDGAATIEMVMPEAAPAGFYWSFGVRTGDNYVAQFRTDGWGLFAETILWQGGVPGEGGFFEQYLVANNRFLRIRFTTDNRPVFEVSGDGSTWRQLGSFSAMPTTWSPRAVETFIEISDSVADASATIHSYTVNGNNISDRSHIDPVAANLLFSDDFTTLDTTRYTIDNFTWADSSNVSIVDGTILRLAVDGGKTGGTTDDGATGSRIYWFNPPLRRYGRYQWRLRHVSAPGAGPAVMLWPSSDQWSEGEMDVFEGGSTALHTTIHDFPNAPLLDPHETHRESMEPFDMSVFRIVTFEWTPTLMRAWVDGRLYYYNADTGYIPNTDFRIDMHHSFDFGSGVVPQAGQTGHLEVDWIKLYEIPGVSLLATTP